MVLVSQTWLDVVLLVVIGIFSFVLLIGLPAWFCFKKQIIECLSKWLAKNKNSRRERADSDAGASSRPLSKISVIDWRGAHNQIPSPARPGAQPQVQVHVYHNGVLLAIKDEENQQIDPNSQLQVGVFNPNNNVGTLLKPSSRLSQCTNRTKSLVVPRSQLDFLPEECFQSIGRTLQTRGSHLAPLKNLLEKNRQGFQTVESKISSFTV